MDSVPFVKDLGVYVSSNLKWSKHISFICNQAKIVSYRILKSFRTKNIWTFIKLFKTYIRPKVEYNSPIWSPFLSKDINQIEQIQRHFTKIACCKCNIPFSSYQDRLQKLNLRSLETRRIHFDLILLFKMIHKICDLSFDDFFQYRPSKYVLRSHPLQIEPKLHFKSSQWLNSFFVRTPKIWNELPTNIVIAPSLPIFKYCLKSYTI